MQWYVYKGNYLLGEEPLGSDDRLIIRDLKTLHCVKKRICALWGDVPCRIYSFTDFSDNDTFMLRWETE